MLRALSKALSHVLIPGSERSRARHPCSSSVAQVLSRGRRPARLTKTRSRTGAGGQDAVLTKLKPQDLECNRNMGGKQAVRDAVNDRSGFEFELYLLYRRACESSLR